MNIHHVTYALTVYDYHSFTEASKALYISQPRLSQAIHELEDELGFEIFIRNKRGISGTTEKGLLFLERARTLLKQFSSLEELKNHNLSSFHVSTTLITQAQDAYLRLCEETIDDPHLNMDLWFSGCYETAERVHTSASDIGVVALLADQFDNWMHYFRSKDLEYHELHAGSTFVTTSKDSPLADKKLIYADDLKDYTYIAERCSRLNDLTVKVYSLLDTICPDSRITASNTDMMYRLAGSTGRKKTFVFEPYPPSKATLEKYGLVTIRFEDLIQASIGYLTHCNHKESTLMTRYVELLKEELAIDAPDRPEESDSTGTN